MSPLWIRDMEPKLEIMGFLHLKGTPGDWECSVGLEVLPKMKIIEIFRSNQHKLPECFFKGYIFVSAGLSADFWGTQVGTHSAHRGPSPQKGSLLEGKWDPLFHEWLNFWFP